ncbi:hypothetical protein GGU10DRAFT_337613, partial [Lentinula aff. detonsa]
MFSSLRCSLLSLLLKRLAQLLPIRCARFGAASKLIRDSGSSGSEFIASQDDSEDDSDEDKDNVYHKSNNNNNPLSKPTTKNAKCRLAPVCMGPSSGGNANANVNVCTDVLRIGAAIERRLYERVRTVADVNVGSDDGAVAGLMLPVSLATLNPILFRDHATASLGKKFFSLFPGLGYAARYKVTQRVYKFGGQPYFNDLINQHFRDQFTNAFGERKGKLMMQATAGSLTGIGEVVLLPLDVLKIKRQEKSALYRGWGWTMARNAPGSFALFGASAVTKDYVLGITDYSKATWTQNFIASIAGTVTPITVAAPLDTIFPAVPTHRGEVVDINYEFEAKNWYICLSLSEFTKNDGQSSSTELLLHSRFATGPNLGNKWTLRRNL